MTNDTTLSDVKHGTAKGERLILDFGATGPYYEAAERHWNAVVRVDGVVVGHWHYVNMGSGVVISLATNAEGQRYRDPNTGQPAWKLWRGVVTVEHQAPVETR